MNKEQVINDEMVKEFLNETFCNYSKACDKWEAFKSSHQPRQEEWEVVELYCGAGNPQTYEQNMFAYKTREYWVECFTGHGNSWKIHKVRRISDGAVLEVGKEYEIGTYSNFHVIDFIKKIVIEHGEIAVNTSFHCFKSSSIESVKEVKPNMNWAVFTKEGLGFPVWQEIYWKEGKVKNCDESIKMFETPHEAKEFIAQHKPHLSLAMIREALATNAFYTTPNIAKIVRDIETGLSKLKSKE